MNLTVFGAFLVLNFIAASSGGIFKPGVWYASLQKPGWTPPNWAFPIVWSTLFLMNAAAGAIAWEASKAASSGGLSAAFVVYGIGLAINFVWSALFFGMKRMDWALGDVVLLWMAIVAQIAFFAPISPLAALLGLPYLAWVTLAAVLNIRMIQMNNGVAAESA
ncbi:MAG: TspO/MBR family protein [Pseudomonadota bacterium]